MADQAVLPPGRRAERAGGIDETVDPDEADDLTSLRAILVGPAEQKIQALQARIDDRFAQARDVGAVLPQALLHRASDPELARALTPPVERAITASVRRDPRPLADALFPVIGPAIRKAVSASLASMVESLNRTLEHSLSARAMQWRFEAIRTGKSFGEIVLAQYTVVSRRAGLPDPPQDRPPASARARGPCARRRRAAGLGDAHGHPRFRAGLLSSPGTGFAGCAEGRRALHLDRTGPGSNSRGGDPRNRTARAAAGSPTVSGNRSSPARRSARRLSGRRRAFRSHASCSRRMPGNRIPPRDRTAASRWIDLHIGLVAGPGGLGRLCLSRLSALERLRPESTKRAGTRRHLDRSRQRQVRRSPDSATRSHAIRARSCSRLKSRQMTSSDSGSLTTLSCRASCCRERTPSCDRRQARI